jgi:hypothetical protein
LLDGFPDSVWKEWTLCHLAVAAAEHEDCTGALAILPAITELDPRVFALEGIVSHCPSAHHLVDELRVNVSQLGHSSYVGRNEPDGLFATCLAAGLFDEALSVGETFEGPYRQAEAIAELVRRLGAARARSEVAGLLRKARALAPGIGDAEGEDEALSAIANAYAAADMPEECREAIDAIHMLDQRMAPLAAMAMRSLAAGRDKEAGVLLAELVATCHSMMRGPDASRQAWPVEDPITTCLQIGRIEEPLRLVRSMQEGVHKEAARLEICGALIGGHDLDRAWQLADEMRPGWSQARAFSQLAAAYLEMGDAGKASHALLAAACRGKTDSPSDREAVWALELSGLLSKNCFEKEAREVTQCVETARSMSTHGRAQAFLHLARRAAAAGDTGPAGEAMEAASRAAQGGDRYSLADIAVQYQLMGGSEAAASALERAVHAAVAEGSESARLETLRIVAVAYCAAGQDFPPEVTRLLERLAPPP